VLLQRNAPVNAKDDTFGGTALGWALYAWGGGGPHAGSSRYYDVVRLLVAARRHTRRGMAGRTRSRIAAGDKDPDDARMRAALETIR
jgi:hypothetical protein